MKTYHFSELQSKILREYIFKNDFLKSREKFSKYNWFLNRNNWFLNRIDQYSIEWDDDNSDDDQDTFNSLMNNIDKYIKLKGLI